MRAYINAKTANQTISDPIFAEWWTQT